MLFTIVTVCYNAADVLEGTILSVLNQSYRDFEYIIIDGGSTDGCVDVIKKYVGRLAYWVSERDGGIYDAMNKGIQHANGKYINFMNAGDCFFNEDILTMVSEQIVGRPAVVFGDTAIVRNGVKYKLKTNPFYEYESFPYEMGFCHQSTFVRTDIAKQKKFDLGFKLAADYNMIVSIYREGGEFQRLHDLIIANFDLSGASDNRRRQHIAEALMIAHPNRQFYNRFLLNCIMLKLTLKRVVWSIVPSDVYARMMGKRQVM